MIIRYSHNHKYTNDRVVYLQFWLDLFNAVGDFDLKYTETGVFKFGDAPHASYDITGLRVIAKRYNEPILSYRSEQHDTFYPDIKPMHIYNVLERMFVLTTEKRRIICDMIPEDIGEKLFTQLKLQEPVCK